MRHTFSTLLKGVFGTRAAALYLLIFAIAIGTATFIENDFGTSAAQKVVYRSRWFELLLFLFGGSILANMFRYKLIQRKKWAVLLFHGSIVVILIGAGFTRYLGFEGMMHIRENDRSNRFLSTESFLKFDIEKNGKRYQFEEPVHFASLGNNQWKGSFQLDDVLFEAEMQSFIPNPVQVLKPSLDGKPTIKIVIAGANGRENYFLSQGQKKRIKSQVFNFNERTVTGAVNIFLLNDSLFFQTDQAYTTMVMATQERDSVAARQGPRALMLRSLYDLGGTMVVFAAYEEKGKVGVESEKVKMGNESFAALAMECSMQGKKGQVYVYGRKGSPGQARQLRFGDAVMSVSYGSKFLELPFNIGLKKFILEKYPGTNSPASYASEVHLSDPSKNVEMDYRIYMNNILNHDGYRFFQSSYDKDERGTYLSVNNDFWGTYISYLGYGLLALGMLLTLFSRKTRFAQLKRSLATKRARQAAMGLAILMLAGTTSQLQAKSSSLSALNVVSKEYANHFSHMVVQDFKGRMKPMHTLNREILRKVVRKTSWQNMNADQVVLSMFMNPSNWYQQSLVKLGQHPLLAERFGLEGKYASYASFFQKDGSYLLQDELRRIQSLPKSERGVFEKEVLKIDERVNILNMVFSGTIFRIIPLEGNVDNRWVSIHRQSEQGNNSVAARFFPAWRTALRKGADLGDFSEADALLNELAVYQLEKGAAVIPSQTQIHGEILLNEMNVFSRLSGLYMVLGLGFLTLLFVGVFKPRWKLDKAFYGLLVLAGIGFLFHSLGLGLRWYVSGRAPWSNGYESMIYIGWTTTLAGLIFSRKSIGGMAATMVLAGTILFVSMLSFLDPEITPLQPVLRSYWLTIHVSMEAGSYGFLMLGAIIGIINLGLMSCLRSDNLGQIKIRVQELSTISELTITAGLFMMSIGTFLGGVWANESWGRYWGWDAKETWALVSILVYAFILHMRLIPKLNGQFAFNFASVFGLASVVMTYYGVNYYLSGLHSYATGDPVPIPSWVYMFSAFVLGLSILAFYKKRRYWTRTTDRTP